MHAPSVLLLAVALAGCHAASAPPPAPSPPDVALARAPFTAVEVQWKERLGLRYLHRELVGDYRRTPEELGRLRDMMRRYDVPAAGPAFALFYDDPSETPVERLRSRVCVPVDPAERRRGPWEYDDLPTATVAYAVAAAERGAVPLVYPAVFRFLDEHGWAADGPVREVYLIDPGRNAPPDAVPWTEVQVPWRPGGAR